MFRALRTHTTIVSMANKMHRLLNHTHTLLPVPADTSSSTSVFNCYFAQLMVCMREVIVGTDIFAFAIDSPHSW